MKTESDKGGGVAGHPFGKKKIGCFDKIPLKKGSGSPLFQSVFSPPPFSSSEILDPPLEGYT